MTSRDFCYWLQGFIEISGPTTISRTETENIKKTSSFSSYILNTIHGSSDTTKIRC